MRVLYASSEVVPYSKTGGLGDVAGALPPALAAIGCDISLVTPRYRGLGRGRGDVVQAETGHLLFDDLRVPFAGEERLASVWRDSLGGQGGVPIYFIDQSDYFGHGYIYGAGDFDAERFAFFSRAVLELAKRIGPAPDLIHCHDWQTGFIPAYLASTYSTDPFFAGTATLFTIHNLGYQGWFSPSLLERFGIGWDLFHRGIEFRQSANAMKAGISLSTALSTVSPRYAREIQTPEYGHDLDGLLRWRSGDLLGILNGVDYQEWNPASDPALAAPFRPGAMEGKRICKQALLEKFHLPVDLDRPLLAVVSRLTVQKGVDLLAESIWRILDTGAYFIMLGSGSRSYEDYFQHVRDTRPHQVGVHFGFNQDLSHQIEAGADLFLMPSAYEPCGLNQMYSLRYGTVPIVRAVGGLDDSIEPFEPATGQGTGFKFDEYSSDRLVEKIYEALLLFYDPPVWATLQANGMRVDFSWNHSARQYLEAYHRIIAQHRMG
jgi:starch synthase